MIGQCGVQQASSKPPSPPSAIPPVKSLWASRFSLKNIEKKSAILALGLRNNLFSGYVFVSEHLSRPQSSQSTVSPPSRQGRRKSSANWTKARTSLALSGDLRKRSRVRKWAWNWQHQRVNKKLDHTTVIAPLQHFFSWFKFSFILLKLTLLSTYLCLPWKKPL